MAIIKFKEIMEKVLIGAGGFAREIKAAYNHQFGKNLKMFVDDEYYREEDGLHRISELNFMEHIALIAVGDPKSKEAILRKLPKNIAFWSFISPDSKIIDRCKIQVGHGVIICAGCILTTNIKLGNHVHLNLNTTVGHDSILEDFVTTAPNVNISGNVHVKESVYLGTNSVVKEKITIGKDIVVGLNAGVVSDLTESGVYVGTPAKIIKKNVV